MKRSVGMITSLASLSIYILLTATGCALVPVTTTPVASPLLVPPAAATPKLPAGATSAPASLTRTSPAVGASPTFTSLPSLSPTSPIAGGSARFNEPFTLQMSQSAGLPDANNTRVVFTNVLEDSRCPSDANCIQPGRVRVAINVESAGRLARFDLSTNAFDLETVGAFNSNLFELVEVTPLPARAGASILPGDYRVTLRVQPGALDLSTARFNEPFSLQLGQSVGFEGSTLRLTFDSVQQDSRCPTRVLCASSGTVVVGVTAAHDGASETDSVQVGGNEVMTSFPAVRTVSVRIRANALTPYPQQEFASKEIAPNDYQATFVVVNPATPIIVPTPR